MKPLPETYTARDGTVFEFFRLAKGTRYGKRSYGYGAHITRADGRKLKSWGLMLREHWNEHTHKRETLLRHINGHSS